ncbi:MAG: hypothetical protein WCE51_00890 [Chthoniobacterales bacterium]
MKPTSISKIEHQLARHDCRAQSNRHFPATDHFFRPQPDVPLGRAGHHPNGDPARGAFRRMTAEMMETQSRGDSAEMIVLAIVIAIITWPLISLLIVLAQIANG